MRQNGALRAQDSDETVFSKDETVYLDLIEQAKRELGLPDEDSPWHDSAAARHQTGGGAASVFEFGNDDKAKILTMSSANELQKYFSESSESRVNSNDASLRRLVLMEGKDPKMMEVLGKNVGMPPSIFLLHCLDTDKLKGKHDLPSVNYLRRVEFLANQASGDHGWQKYTRVCVPRRTSGFDIDEIPELHEMFRERHFLSFWSKEEGTEGSWTTVLLCDTGDGIPSAIGGEKLISRRLNTDVVSMHQDSPTVFVSETVDTFYCLLQRSYKWFPHCATADPGSAMRYCIPIILSMFETELKRSRYRIGRRSRHYFKRLQEFRGDAWQTDEAAKIAQLQLAIVRNINMYSDCVTRLDILCGNPYVSETGVKSWRWLREQLRDQSEQVQLLLDFYGIRASVEESIFSNRQAKHIGQLTALATFLVPFSVVAGIFSMSGDFAAGQSLFWIFWVVAVPLSCIIFFIRMLPFKAWLSQGRPPVAWPKFEPRGFADVETGKHMM